MFHASARFERVGIVVPFAGAEFRNAVDLRKLDVVNGYKLRDTVRIDVVRVAVVYSVRRSGGCGVAGIFTAGGEESKDYYQNYGEPV